MKQLVKAATGVFLILLFSPVVLGAVVVGAIAIAAYKVEPGLIGRVLGICFMVGLPSLFICMAGVQLLRGNMVRQRGD
jgi:hypothetical protein